jgi:hypothetical protein
MPFACFPFMIGRGAVESLIWSPPLIPVDISEQNKYLFRKNTDGFH